MAWIGLRTQWEREKALLPELLRKACPEGALSGDEQEGARSALQVQELQEQTQEVVNGAAGSRGGEGDLEGPRETSEAGRASPSC